MCRSPHPSPARKRARIAASATAGAANPLAGVTILTSTSGDARIDVILNPARTLGDAYNALGYGWDKHSKDRRVLFTAGPATTLKDLLRICALRVERKAETNDGRVTCVLSSRSYFGYASYCTVNKVCQAAGFTRFKGVGWTQCMPTDAMRKLERVVGTRSAERAEEKAASQRLEEGVRKHGRSLETQRHSLAAKWEADVLSDPTFARRDAQYTQLLLTMASRNEVSRGSDGAPNWPSPPVPGQSGIVAKGSEHLACFPPHWA